MEEKRNAFVALHREEKSVNEALKILRNMAATSTGSESFDFGLWSNLEGKACATDHAPVDEPKADLEREEGMKTLQSALL